MMRRKFILKKNYSNSLIKPLGLLSSLSIYLFAALLLFVVTHYAIPFLTQTTGQESIFFLFVAGGLGVFVPLILIGIAILKRERVSSLSVHLFTRRLRFRPMTKRDWLYCLYGFVGIMVTTSILLVAVEQIWGSMNPTPSFLSFEPLSEGRYWLLGVWVVFWLLNIGGEEFLWRGVMFPRQEIVFGKWTWLVHGSGWALFHLAFWFQPFIMLLPLIYIQSYVVQKTKNSWTGVILHGGINGPAFIAISLGLI